MTSPPKVEVALCSDEDIPLCFDVVSKSFGHDAPFVDIYFPLHDTAVGQAKGTARLLAWKQNSKDSTFLKAVTQSGRIIGIGVWTLMKQPPPAELEKVENVTETWPDERDREFMTRLWKEYVIPRSQVITQSHGAGVYVLELLAVHPDFQRQGAGTALVRWGTNAADEKGLESIVEGTPIGRRTYENCGLVTAIEEMRFDVGEGFDDRRKPFLHFMRRKAKT